MSGNQPMTVDFAIVGSGPAGHQAALQARRLGKTVALIERDRNLGGACVYHGTIPSKTLRETALTIESFPRRTADAFVLTQNPEQQVASLMRRKEQVLDAHNAVHEQQLDQMQVKRIHGRASFRNERCLEVIGIGGTKTLVEANFILLAVGSYPRNPQHIAIDHEHLLDSDSFLSMIYQPKTLIVLGSGVIACEYASIFNSLGTEVTIIDKYPGPLGFLDTDIASSFVQAFEASGRSKFVGDTVVSRADYDITSGNVVVTCDDGQVLRAQKLLCAAGRAANVRYLHLERAGLAVNDRGVIPVDEHGRTQVRNIYAIGDVIGPPSLGSASMDQGRRAVNHACQAKQDGPSTAELPMGIYTIPEIGAVGMTEAQAQTKHGDSIRIGVASFGHSSRGHIAAIAGGMLKLVAAPDGRLLGVHIIGEGASELIAIGQLALQAKWPVERLAETIFNFPTLAEVYQVAALNLLHPHQS